MASKAETLGRLKPQTSRRWDEGVFEILKRRFEEPGELPIGGSQLVTTDDSPEPMLSEALVGWIGLGLRKGM